jgi:hypothetical protein
MSPLVFVIAAADCNACLCSAWHQRCVTVCAPFKQFGLSDLTIPILSFPIRYQLVPDGRHLRTSMLPAGCRSALHPQSVLPVLPSQMSRIHRLTHDPSLNSPLLGGHRCVHVRTTVLAVPVQPPTPPMVWTDSVRAVKVARRLHRRLGDWLLRRPHLLRRYRRTWRRTRARWRGCVEGARLEARRVRDGDDCRRVCSCHRGSRCVDSSPGRKPSDLELTAPCLYHPQMSARWMTT